MPIVKLVALFAGGGMREWNQEVVSWFKDDGVRAGLARDEG